MTISNSNNKSISQEYFDELCLENREIFDDLSEEEAVQETVHQLRQTTSNQQQQQQASLQHLTLTYPTSAQGIAVRERISAFNSALQSLAGATPGGEDDSHAGDPQPKDADVADAAASEANEVQAQQLVDEQLRVIEDALQQQQQDSNADRTTAPPSYSYLFLQQGGFRIFLDAFSRLVKHPKDEMELEAVACLLRILKDLVYSSRKGAVFRRALQEDMPRAMPAWVQFYDHLQQQQSLWTGTSTSASVTLLLLEIAHASIKRCETNKRLWMKTKASVAETNEEVSFAAILLGTLKSATKEQERESSSCNDDDDDDDGLNIWIGIQICQILTTLVTFDDFSSNSDDNTGPVVQSGNVHAHQLANHGAVLLVHQFLQTQHNINSAIARAAAISTLRSLAIQDDLVQSMVAVGVLDTTCCLLERGDNEIAATPTSSCDPAALPTAVLGLLRNVAANDDIKTTLCRRPGFVANVVVQNMQTFPAVPLLQEHACGLAAAMALRKPQNAVILVQEAHIHVEIVAAMRRHPETIALQRQAALAIRNLVSRATPELKTLVLEGAPTEETLRHVAGKLLGCQDEVYAALRDLGLPVSSVHVQHHQDGTVTVHQGREMFGERNPNFRPFKMRT